MTDVALTRTDVARTVAEVVAEDDARIDGFASQLPAEMLASTLLRAAEIRRALQRLELALEQRYGEEVGTAHVDQDGTQYQWSSDRTRVATDVEGLFAQLLALGVPPAQLGRAVSARGLRWTDLERIAGRDEEKKAALREFFEWKEGPRHLKRVEAAREGGHSDGD